MAIPGLSYTLGRTLYVALTNRCNSVPLFSTRGPGFQMPAASGFAPLPDGVEPSAEQVAEAVAAAADVDAVCFAGVGRARNTRGGTARATAREITCRLG